MMVHGLILALESEAGRSQELKGSLDVYTVSPRPASTIQWVFESFSLSKHKNNQTKKKKKYIKIWDIMM